MLHSNLVGFQTDTYARHFISTCSRILGVETDVNGVEFNNGLVVVKTFPIGVDLQRVQRYRCVSPIILNEHINITSQDPCPHYRAI